METRLHLFLGSLLTATGLLLAGYGALTDPGLYARSLGWNVNLWWGLLMAGFGSFFLALWKKR